MELEHVLYEKQGGVGIITLNRPQALNALSRDHLADLHQALTWAEFDPEVRCVVFTGAGRGFSAGADVKEWASGTEKPEEPEANWASLAHGLIARVYRLAKPVVAAVNGLAYGAGCDLTLAADFRIASSSARFCEAYIKLAYCPDAGGSFLLPRLVGEARAMDMIYTGRVVEAAEADSWGLLYKLVEPDELMAATMELAERLAKGPTIGIALAKENIRQNWNLSIEDALRNERRSGEICGKTEDAAEGLAATIERREANFKGR